MYYAYICFQGGIFLLLYNCIYNTLYCIYVYISADSISSHHHHSTNCDICLYACTRLFWSFVCAARAAAANHNNLFIMREWERREEERAASSLFIIIYRIWWFCRRFNSIIITIVLMMTIIVMMMIDQTTKCDYIRVINKHTHTHE